MVPKGSATQSRYEVHNGPRKHPLYLRLWFLQRIRSQQAYLSRSWSCRKGKPVKKPRAKKVIEEMVVAPAIPLATVEEVEALHAMVEALLAADAEQDEVSEVAEEIEPTDEELTEIKIAEVDAAFEAETEEEVFDASDVTDEEATAFLDQYAALFA